MWLKMFVIVVFCKLYDFRLCLIFFDGLLVQRMEGDCGDVRKRCCVCKTARGLV